MNPNESIRRKNVGNLCLVPRKQMDRPILDIPQLEQLSFHYFPYALIGYEQGISINIKHKVLWLMPNVSG